MRFCKKCGSILKPKSINDKKVLGCDCGFFINETTKFSSKNNDTQISVISEDEPSAHTIADEECVKCKNSKAYTWGLQTEPSDEPEVMIFKCTKCGHTWR